MPIPTPTADQPSADRPSRLPRGWGKSGGLVVWVIIVAIIIPAVRCAVDNPPAIDPVQEWGLSTDQIASEYGQSAGQADIDAARLILMSAYQVKSQAWLEAGRGEFPSPEYLLVDELLAFQAQAATVNTPSPENLRALYWTWTTSLSRLVLAEQALAREANQANLDARNQAWADEAAAYQAFYDR